MDAQRSHQRALRDSVVDPKQAVLELIVNAIDGAYISKATNGISRGDALRNPATATKVMTPQSVSVARRMAARKRMRTFKRRW